MLLVYYSILEYRLLSNICKNELRKINTRIEFRFQSENGCGIWEISFLSFYFMFTLTNLVQLQLVTFWNVLSAQRIAAPRAHTVCSAGTYTLKLMFKNQGFYLSPSNNFTRVKKWGNFNYKRVSQKGFLWCIF